MESSLMKNIWSNVDSTASRLWGLWLVSTGFHPALFVFNPFGISETPHGFHRVSPGVIRIQSLRDFRDATWFHRVSPGVIRIQSLRDFGEAAWFHRALPGVIRIQSLRDFEDSVWVPPSFASVIHI
jgi:hypothetical protein